MSKVVGPNWAFKMMALIHDHPLRRKFYDPIVPLENAGLSLGKNVLEVGCGPAFFTIPAAKIVGENGKVYALDIHPLAIKTVKEKMEKENITNIEPVLADITNTSFSEDFFDVVFLFGTPRMLRNEKFLDSLLKELYRVLKPNGLLSIKSKKTEIRPKIEKKGFAFEESKEGVLRFIKT